MSNIDKIEFEVDGALIGGSSNVQRINALKYKCRDRNQPFEFSETLDDVSLIVKLTESHSFGLYSFMDDARFSAIEEEINKALV